MQERTFQKVSETVRDGFATPHRLTGLPGTLSGCIYRADGTKVALSERFGGYAGDHFATHNPDALPRPETARKLPGRGLYLGNYMGGHYGHFITETLSTFWIFEDEPADTFDYVLFHPFVFGDAIPDYVKFCFEKFGISEDKVIVAGGEVLAFEELVVPERLFRLNHSSDPRLRWVFGHLTSGARAPQAAPERLYVSRRRFSRRDLFRVVANEAHIETAFQRRGFEVIYPESMSFEDQIALYSRAQWVAGISGSGLHNSLFMQPGATIIELGDPRYSGKRSPTQMLCDGVSGVRNELIPFVGQSFGGYRVTLFDMRLLQARLDAILQNGPGAPTPLLPSPGLSTRLQQIAEATYLCVRTIGGTLARGTLNRLGFSK
ncbi:MAG: glycosyltransferase family 61 protein [Phenylobacterium sp.]